MGFEICHAEYELTVRQACEDVERQSTVHAQDPQVML